MRAPDPRLFVRVPIPEEPSPHEFAFTCRHCEKWVKEREPSLALRELCSKCLDAATAARSPERWAKWGAFMGCVGIFSFVMCGLTMSLAPLMVPIFFGLGGLTAKYYEMKMDTRAVQAMIEDAIARVKGSE